MQKEEEKKAVFCSTKTQWQVLSIYWFTQQILTELLLWPCVTLDAGKLAVGKVPALMEFTYISVGEVDHEQINE